MVEDSYSRSPVIRTRNDTPAPGPLFTLFPPPLKYSRALSCTAAYCHLGWFFFWIDAKRSVFIVNFLDRI